MLMGGMRSGIPLLTSRLRSGRSSTLVCFRLPAMPVLFRGTEPPTPEKLAQSADAMLYLGSRDSLAQVFMRRAELDGTPYEKEIERRPTIEGFPAHFVPEKEERPQFSRPQPATGRRPPLPPMPKNMDAPLPPRHHSSGRSSEMRGFPGIGRLSRGIDSSPCDGQLGLQFPLPSSPET